MNDGGDTAVEAPLKRILITADAVGGVWQYTVDLVRCLVSDGVAVAVATMGAQPSDEQRRQLPSGVRLVTSNYALEWTPQPWKDVDAAAPWLLQLRDSFQPDLVHLNGYAHASLDWGCPVLVGAHSCVVSWWQAVHGCDPGPEWHEYRRRLQAGLLACDRIVTPSQFMAGEIAAHYGVAPSKISTIWNSSSTPAAQNAVKQTFCLAAGRVWDKAKNFALLRQVASKILWPIRLAGSDAVSDFAPVQILGRLPYSKLLKQMIHASVFLHPAVYEPFGLAILEAARAGCCLVLSDTASARELWDGAAVFVDSRKPSEWVDALNKLSDDPGERASRGLSALQRSKRYSEDRFHAAYRELYRRLLLPPVNPSESAA